MDRSVTKYICHLTEETERKGGGEEKRMWKQWSYKERQGEYKVLTQEVMCRSGVRAEEGDKSRERE